MAPFTRQRHVSATARTEYRHVLDTDDDCILDCTGAHPADFQNDLLLTDCIPMKPKTQFAQFIALCVTLCTLATGSARACPFCGTVGQTFTQEIESLDAAVIVDSVDLKKMPPPDVEGPFPKSTFRVKEVIKGEQWASVGSEIKTAFFGEPTPGTYLIFGADAPDIIWTTPVQVNERVAAYLRAILKLPPKGSERLAFFQKYLEDADELLSADAYDEFARAPYDEVVALKPLMEREKIRAWIEDVDGVPAHRRRLYLTMLGICGEPQDADVLEKFMRSDQLQDKLGLDAMIACYLSLRGSDGMPVITELFLDNPDAECAHIYSAILALRFHATETDVLTRQQVLVGLRYLLDREELADLVIPDLARMEDWDALPKLVELFRHAKPGESWARVPIINYVRACPLPAADEALETLKEIDPKAVQRASSFFPFAPKSVARPGENNNQETRPEAAKAADSANESNIDKNTATQIHTDISPERDPATIATDVPGETQRVRTVSSVISLPFVGEGNDGLSASSDHLTNDRQENPTTSQAPSGTDVGPADDATRTAATLATPEVTRFSWPIIGALVVAGVLLTSLIPRRQKLTQNLNPSGDRKHDDANEPTMSPEHPEPTPETRASLSDPVESLSDSSDEYLKYRELSMGAVASLVLGIVSFIALPFVSLALIPLLGAILGFRAAREIKSRPEDLTGLTFARIGGYLSAGLLVASISYAAFDHATEVPNDCIRVLWRELQPDNIKTRLPVSERSLELHNKRIFIEGFVFPDDKTSELQTFVLVPDRGTCCFGGDPPLTHMIQVHLKDPLRVKYSFRQRKLGGILKVDTRRKPVSGLGGVYYQLEADYVR